MTMQQAELLTRLRNGEQAAFRELVHQCQGAMMATARAILGLERAEEVVQDAWLAAVRHLDGFEGRSSLKTWLITITVNTARARLRKDRRGAGEQAPLPVHAFDADARFAEDGHWQSPPIPWHDDTPEALLEQEVLRDCLDSTLEKLPDNQKAVLVLRERQQMELNDICNILQLSDSNVRVLLHRARLRVFAVLEHFQETGAC